MTEVNDGVATPIGNFQLHGSSDEYLILVFILAANLKVETQQRASQPANERTVRANVLYTFAPFTRAIQLNLYFAFACLSFHG